ncbi:MAG: hydroxymethylbilane synthase [Candidatus Nanopelagicales bacterium]|jgi:hydroxymethylbilane synthase|nr:hydroxymethylbilane synthase [Candidatus Nanopelagicales bacterium]
MSQVPMPPAAQPSPAAPSPAAAPPLRLATRASALALAQSRAVGEELAARTGRVLEVVEVTTQGDVDPGSLTTIGGAGVFVAAVREAVAAGRADLAVHSLKDLPTAPDPRLRLAAIPVREDPSDALVARGVGTLAALPTGARVGTGSPRRRAQLAAARPDLQVVDLRGNVDTRIAHVDGDPSRGIHADLDAVVLAAAGLHRLGRTDRISGLLTHAEMLPAPGQGALAVEVRAGLAEEDPTAGPALLEALTGLDDPATRACVTAERALLAALEAGCSAPVGALAQLAPDGLTLRLQAVLATAHGLLRETADGPADQPEALGRGLATRLLAAEAAGAAGGSHDDATTSTTSTSTTSTSTRTTDPGRDGRPGLPTTGGSPTP